MDKIKKNSEKLLKFWKKPELGEIEIVASKFVPTDTGFLLQGGRVVGKIEGIEVGSHEDVTTDRWEKVEASVQRGSASLLGRALSSAEEGDLVPVLLHPEYGRITGTIEAPEEQRAELERILLGDPLTFTVEATFGDEDEEE